MYLVQAEYQVIYKTDYYKYLARMIITKKVSYYAKYAPVKISRHPSHLKMLITYSKRISIINYTWRENDLRYHIQQLLNLTTRNFLLSHISTPDAERSKKEAVLICC